MSRPSLRTAALFAAAGAALVLAVATFEPVWVRVVYFNTKPPGSSLGHIDRSTLWVVIHYAAEWARERPDMATAVLGDAVSLNLGTGLDLLAGGAVVGLLFYLAVCLSLGKPAQPCVCAESAGVSPPGGDQERGLAEGTRESEGGERCLDRV